MTDSTRRHSRSAAVRAFLMLNTAIMIVPIMTPAAHAQDYTSIAASGRVLAENGQPVRGATVKVTSTDKGVSRTATTDETGAYFISQLPQGDYDFTVSAPDYATYQEQHIALSRGTGGANSFTLAAAGGAGDIVVVGSRQRVSDFSNETTGAVIDLESTDKRVPVARSLQQVILMAPGTIQGTGNGGAFRNEVSISGSAFTENAYYVNGLNITNFRMGSRPVEVPYDFYQTVEVKTGGYPAEFGRATGGVVNAITKSGSNEYHASVLGSWSPDDLRSTSPNTYDTDNRDATSEQRELTFQASGPIVKDHLFVYGLYSLRKFETFTPNSNQDNATRTENDSPFWGVKVDGYVTGDHHLEFTYFNSSNDTRTRSLAYDRTTGKAGDVTGGTNDRAGGINYVGRYTGTFTPWFTISAAYGVNKFRDGQLPLDTTHSRVIDYRNSDSGIDIGLNKVTDALGFTDDKREFYRADADFLFGLLGSHHVRVGYDHETNTSEQIHETIGTGFYKIFTANADSAARLGIPVGTDYYTTRIYANNGNTTVKNEAFYIEDDWTLLNDRLRLQLGLRDDRFSNQGVSGASYYKSGDQWAPRLGVSFDVFGDRKTKAYANYGAYYLPLAGDINLNIAGGLVTYTRYNLLNGLNATDGTPNEGQAILGAATFSACPDTKIANCEVSASGTPADPSGVIDKNLQPQSVREFILGIDHQFSDRIKVSAYFTHRELHNAIEDISVDYGARAYCVGQGFSAAACAKAYPGGSDFVIANPGRDVTTQINALPDGTKPVVTLKAEDLRYPTAKRNYNSMTLTFDRTFDGKWSLSGSYTLAFDKGNYEGGVRSENGQAGVDRTSDFDSPGFVNGSYGYLPNDRRHTIKAYGSYRLFKFLDLGANTTLQSPQHYSCIGTVPFDVDSYANSYHGYSYYCNGTLIPRGTAFNGDWLFNLDASVVAHLPMPKGLEGTLRLDVFNLFNNQAVTWYNSFGQLSDDSPNSNYRKPVTYQTPRYVRLQFRLGF